MTSNNKDNNASLLKYFGYNQDLKRSLNVWQLTAFGLNYMIPLSPAIVFGYVLALSGGTVALPFLIAGIAMLLTASSYITMVRHFPLAGSLYNFISRAWHPQIGALAGWILLLDYLLITTVTSMSAAVYLQQLIPHLSYFFILLTFILATGLINILSINLVACAGLLILIITEVVVLASFIVWAYAIHHQPIGAGVLLSSAPFHFTNFSTLINATSLAVAGYLGFDAITTLAEEAHHPVRDIPKAILICLFIGSLTMFITGYLGVLAYPHWQAMQHDSDFLATLLFHVSTLTGGKVFGQIYSLGFVLSMSIFNIVATAASARLLFGMGRDAVLPRNFFSSLHHKFKTPHLNIILIMLISLLIGSVSRIDDIANLVNYGALLGFSMLNVSVIYYYFKNKTFLPKSFFLTCRYTLIPLLGCLVVLWVFYGLNQRTHILGSIWLILGLLYLYFRKK